MTPREWQRHLEVQAERFAEQVARALRRAIRAGTGRLGQVVTAQGEPEPAEPFVSVDDLAAIETAWRVEVAEALTPAVERYMRAGADQALRELAVEAPVLFDMRQPAAEAHVVSVRNRLVGVGTDTWERTRDQLVIGMREGEDIRQLSKRVRDVVDASEVRARTIARTEVISASNAGAIGQVRLLGGAAPVAKTWLATNDSRTRLSHRAADGQTVALNDEFVVGDAKLDFPGDPDGPGDEIINCRCTVVWETRDQFSETSAFALEVFHMPGKHDQRSHGKSGDGGLTDEELYDATAANTSVLSGTAGKAVSNYKTVEYRNVNEKLRVTRGDVTPDSYRDNVDEDELSRTGELRPRQRENVEIAQQNVAAMDTAFESVIPMMQESFAYRGVGDVSATFGGNPQGMQFTDHAYVSLTTSPDVATDFTRGTDPGRITVIMPPGTRLMNVATAVERTGGEREVLLPRGQRFRVTRATQDDAGWDITMELEP